MVLTDDNFASIVAAVEEGRGIFDDIRKFVQYLLSSNTSEILFMFCAALLDWPVPLAATQILWINLVTDGLPALALGVEPPEAGAMSRPPRPPAEPLITRGRAVRMVLHGSLMAAVALLAFGWVYRGQPERLAEAPTVAFGTLAFTQLFYSLSCRSESRTLPQLGPLSNRPLLASIAGAGLLQAAVLLIPAAAFAFKVVPIHAAGWALMLGAALVPVTIIETGKLLRAWLRSRNRAG